MSVILYLRRHDSVSYGYYDTLAGMHANEIHREFINDPEMRLMLDNHRVFIGTFTRPEEIGGVVDRFLLQYRKDAHPFGVLRNFKTNDVPFLLEHAAECDVPLRYHFDRPECMHSEVAHLLPEL